MCTRFYIESDLQPALESVRLSPLTILMQEVFGKRVTMSGEVRPTDMAAVIASNKRGERGIFPMIWGFTASHSSPMPSSEPMIASEPMPSSLSKSSQPEKSVTGTQPKRPVPIVNCRVETAAIKDLWKDSWLHHRCIIPASYYYEWGHPIKLNPADGRINDSTTRNKKNQKTKYAIQSENELITYLAGLYRLENGYPHFAVLTREPDEEIRFIHNRMPVILKSDQINTWINPQSNIEEINRIAQSSNTKMEYIEIS